MAKMAEFEEFSLMTRVHYVGQSIFQFLLAVFVTSTVWVVANNSDWNRYHTWHIFLTTIGFSFLMAEAISLLNEGNGFLIGVGKSTRKLLHGFFMVFGTGAAVAGIAIKIQDKTDNNSQHFTSVHGKLGLAALILTIFTFLGGFLVYFSAPIYKTCGIKPLWVRILHNLVGCTAYLIGNIALGYGVHDYLRLVSQDTRLALSVILGIYVVISILLGPVRNLLGDLFGSLTKY